MLKVYADPLEAKSLLRGLDSRALSDKGAVPLDLILEISSAKALLPFHVQFCRAIFGDV